MTAKPKWQTCEAELVAEFLRRLERECVLYKNGSPWTVYPETADWDLLLVHRDGFQVGIEAKLTFNAKVIDQALAGQHGNWRSAGTGPDFRAVLVPAIGRQQHLGRICDAIGIRVLTLSDEGGAYEVGMRLPSNVKDPYGWCHWCPAERCTVPDYVPDVVAGVAAPVKLTEWKVKAIKLSIVLDRKGWVDRADMRALGISPSRWTDNWNGFLRRDAPGQYVRCEATPDYRAQHPENYAQIEADVEKWGSDLDPFKLNCPDWLRAKSKAA